MSVKRSNATSTMCFTRRMLELLLLGRRENEDREHSLRGHRLGEHRTHAACRNVRRRHLAHAPARIDSRAHGRIFCTGMSYQVADGASSHKSVSQDGAKLFIVD